VRYFEADDDQLVLRESARDHLVRGAVWVFAVPSAIVGLGWICHALFVDSPSLLSLAVTSAAIGVACAVPAFAGLFLMATANKRAARRSTLIDLGDRTISVPGQAPTVFRKPDAVVVARAGLRSWTLRLEGDRQTTLLRRIPHGEGRDLAKAADALADALGVESSVPTSARRAIGLIPQSNDVWATICYAPIDGVNVAYALLALISSRDAALRFAAKQSLAFLVVEGFVALMVSGCIGIPIAVASAPLAVEAFAFLCPFMILGLIRLLARGVACVKAYRGQSWVMPWLAPLTRRWLPLSADASTH